MNTSVFSLDIWLQFALITRILPFQTSLPIALLTGDWLLRNMAGPNIVYLPDKHNIIADALSCLPKLKEPHDESTFHEEIFAFNEQLDVFPIAFNVISKAQLANNKIQWSITNNDPDFETRIIQCAPLVYFKGKITFPANLHSCVLTWYHKNLLHPVTNWIFHTILQHFTWPSLCPQVENFIKHCNTCQHYKTQQKKYGHIPIQDTQQIANPWHSIAVNTIGWTMDHSTVATFFEIKRAYYTSSIYNHWSKHAFHGNCGIEKQGKHHHHLHPQPSLALPLPHPVDCFLDNGTEFISTKFQELLQSYGIWSKLTTVKNPQANSILKCTHHVIGNLLCSIHLVAQDLATISAQQKLLMLVMWAINTTFHTTLRANPAQLAFNHDMILPTSFATNWYAIISCKQAQSQSATDAKNCKCILHEFHLNDKVLIHCDIGNSYLGKLVKPTQGPFKIIDIQQLPINGTILIQQSLTSVEHVNICQLLPFFEHYNWRCKCCTSVIMTYSHLIHDIQQNIKMTTHD